MRACHDPRPGAGKLFRFLFFVLLLPSPAVPAAPVPLLPAAGEIVAGPGALPARDSPDGLLLAGDLTGTPDRLLWDIPLSRKIPDGARSLVLRYSVPLKQPAAKAISVHLKTPRGWYAYPDPLPLAKDGRANMALSRFQGEGGAGGVPRDACAIRVSIWKGDGPGSSRRTCLRLTSLSAGVSRIAVVQSTRATAGGETAVAALCARRCERALGKAGLSCDVIDDSFDSLSSFTVVFLPYSPSLDGRRTRLLLSYLEKGGKLVVFYNPSPAMAGRFGIDRPLWKNASGTRAWTAFLPSGDFRGEEAASAAIPHLTENLLPPRPSPGGEARVVATWLSPRGTPSRVPACALSPCGAWFAHLPPLAFPATASFYRKILGELAPGILEGAPPAAPGGRPPAMARPATNEVRALWIATPSPRHPEGWRGLFGEWARENSVNTVFLRCDGLAGERDSHSTDLFLPSALAAARERGLAVHGWLACWTTADLPPAARKRLGEEGRLLRGSDGKTRDWLCPDDPRNRAEVMERVTDLASRGVAGVHLDYMRYTDEGCCYCPVTREAFEKTTGEKVADWPADVLPGGRRRAAFLAFRSASLTSWLAGLRAALKKSDPRLLLSVAVVGSASGARSLGQDVDAWCKGGLVDFIVPMAYTEDQGDFEDRLGGFLSLPDVKPGDIVAGIGAGADESQLDAAQAARQLDAVRKAGCRGHAFFKDDVSLRRILRELSR